MAIDEKERNELIERCAKVAQGFEEYPVHRPGCYEIADAIRHLKTGTPFCSIEPETEDDLKDIPI